MSRKRRSYAQAKQAAEEFFTAALRDFPPDKRSVPLRWVKRLFHYNGADFLMETVLAELCKRGWVEVAGDGLEGMLYLTEKWDTEQEGKKEAFIAAWDPFHAGVAVKWEKPLKALSPRALSKFVKIKTFVQGVPLTGPGNIPNTPEDFDGKRGDADDEPRAVDCPHAADSASESSGSGGDRGHAGCVKRAGKTHRRLR